MIEVKAPRVRRPDLRLLEKVVSESSKGLILLKLEGFAKRSMVKVYKEDVAVKSKVYRVLVAVNGGVREDTLKLLELLNGIMVTQRTPRRVLHRRKDITRTRKLYQVKCRVIGGLS